MPRPQCKEDLIEASQTNYRKLMDMIEGMTEKELETPMDFSDTNKKEAHWKRDKNVRDIVIHLVEWHNLLIDWLDQNKAGVRKPFLMEGYNWKTYGEMNLLFWNRNQDKSLEAALEEFKESHAKAMERVEAMSNEELYQAGYYDWTRNSTIGSYCCSTLSSHYEWAMKKLKAHKKLVVN